MKLFGRTLIATGMLAVATAGLASSAFAVGTPAGTLSLSKASGNEVTTLAIAPSSVLNCSGNNTTVPPYRASTFIAGLSVDPTTITFGNGTFLPTGSAATYSSPLNNSTGTSLLNAISVGSAPNNSIGAQSVQLSNLVGDPGFTAGTYNVGLACFQNGGANAGAIDGIVGGAAQYWQSPITVCNVSSTGFTWTSGATTCTPVLPESPLVVALPLSAAAIGIGVYMVRRRRVLPA